MESWLTVINVDLVQEAYLIRSQLELEGFEVRLLDELTTQVAPHFSVANGGVRVQVLEKDWQEASRYLTSLGYKLEEEKEVNKWLISLEKATLKLPFLKNLRFEARLLIIISFVLAAILTPIAILSIPSDEEILSRTLWCVGEVKYKGQTVAPMEEMITLSLNGCLQSVSFSEFNTVVAPPFGDESMGAIWSIKDDKLILIPRDRGGMNVGSGKNNLFLDTFKFELTATELILVSDETWIRLLRYEI